MQAPEIGAGRRERILLERARKLALGADAGAVAAGIELLLFELAQECFAVETRCVRKVVTLGDLTPLPCVPAHVLGIINVRGEIVPVIELRRLFGMPERGLTNATRAVILRDAEREFGIVADTVPGVRAVPEAAMLPPPATLAGMAAEFLRGVTAEGLIVLNAEKVLGHPAMIVNERVDEGAPAEFHQGRERAQS